MDERVLDRDDTNAPSEEDHCFADALVALGEGKAAVDLLRRKVNAERGSVPAPAFLRLLSAYAGVLESADALAEAEFIRAEAQDLVEAGQITTIDAVDAFLKYGLLLCRMHNYDGGVTRLKETVRRVEALDGIGALHREIILAQAWRGQAQAYEELGEFSEASEALDALMNVKRTIRFIVFAQSPGR